MSSIHKINVCQFALLQLHTICLLIQKGGTHILAPFLKLGDRAFPIIF